MGGTIKWVWIKWVWVRRGVGTPPPAPLGLEQERAWFELGIAHALSSEPFASVREATAIISPFGLTSTSVVPMLALLVVVVGTGGSLATSCVSSP